MKKTKIMTLNEVTGLDTEGWTVLAKLAGTGERFIHIGPDGLKRFAKHSENYTMTIKFDDELGDGMRYLWVESLDYAPDILKRSNT